MKARAPSPPNPAQHGGKSRRRSIRTISRPKIMQSFSNFTVGGSLSVNCHGDYVGLGPVVESVRSLRIVTADGAIQNYGLGDRLSGSLHELAHEALRRRVGQRQALADLDGAVLCDIPSAISSLIAGPRRGCSLGVAVRCSAMSDSSTRSRSMRASSRHDGDVNQDQREEDQVGGGDVGPGLVERERGRQSELRRRRAGERPGGASPDSGRFSARAAWRLLGGQLELPQRHEQASPSRPTRQERQPHLAGHEPRLSTARAGGERLRRPHGHEVQRHERAADDRETAA